MRQPALSDPTLDRLQKIIEGLRAVPVNVDIKVLPVEKQVPGQHPIDFSSTVDHPEVTSEPT